MGKKVYQPSDLFRVTFAGSVLPNFVKLDGAFFPVRLFEQRVYECTNCKRLGHTASHCGNKFRCSKCGEKHAEDSCTQVVEKCIHCGENPPHPLQSCPMVKQRAEKVKRSIIGRSKQTYAQMLKSASAAQDGNQFSILSTKESDSDSSDEGDSSVVHVPSTTDGASKRKCSSPKVLRKKTKVTPKRLQNSQGNREHKTKPKDPAAPIPGCSKNFPPLPKKKKNNTTFVFNAAPQTSKNTSKSDRGLLAFSDMVESILNMFNIQDPLRSLVYALLPILQSILKQLTVSWPLLASIISFDG